jgi:FMN phosphatase YigB (HAD superfamily)
VLMSTSELLRFRRCDGGARPQERPSSSAHSSGRVATSLCGQRASRIRPRGVFRRSSASITWADANTWSSKGFDPPAIGPDWHVRRSEKVDRDRQPAASARIRQRVSARYNRGGLSPTVDSERRFRALSLDLWFTVLYYAPERDDQWREDRARLLGNSLRTRDGQRVDLITVKRAIDSVHSRLRTEQREPITLDPEELIPLYTQTLNAELTVPLTEFARLYSSVGLQEHPPIANPEAVAIVKALTDRKIPVIAITNTARRGSTWRDYLRDQVGLEFRHVVSSCDCGAAKPDPAIFREAARRIGLASGEILHVGDSWELDVEGALRAGFGPMLYRGLWKFYPDGESPDTGSQVATAPKVPVVDRLDEILGRHFLT